ncbi:MAG: response regulator transcription factor [Clostridium sp.]|nr:response regulator transcription factor [Clostridium sp.]
MYKLMLVEDEEKIRNITKDALTKWGFKVYSVENFNNVFEEFINEKPELIIMDINLPSYDGFHWCNEIRKISKVPILFLSSRSTNMDIVMAVNMGGDDYVTKPFSMEVLVAKINALLRRAYSYVEAQSETVDYKGIVLSIKDNMVHYRELKLELTKNEFKILYILMRKHETIVSREKLMQELWEDESFIDDNTLTVNINRLRKKLKGIGICELIKTIKNQGYIIK